MALIAHCGAKRISLKALEAQEEQPQKLTDTHYPMRHDTFINLVKDEAKSIGMEITSEEYALKVAPPGESPNGRRAAYGFDDIFGVLGIKSEYTGLEHCLAVRGSNTMNISRQIGAGNRVFCCDNLAFNAQVVVGRKHTLRIQEELPDMVNDAIGRMAALFEYDQTRIDVYNGTKVDDAGAHDVMMRAIQGGIREERTPATKLSSWVDEWHEPSHDEFKPRNAWSLLNAHTELAKSWNFDAMAKRTEKVQGILDEKCGVHEECVNRMSNRYKPEVIASLQISLAE